jgi:hypothetical protein
MDTEFSPEYLKRREDKDREDFGDLDIAGS